MTAGCQGKEEGESGIGGQLDEHNIDIEFVKVCTTMIGLWLQGQLQP